MADANTPPPVKRLGRPSPTTPASRRDTRRQGRPHRLLDYLVGASDREERGTALGSRPDLPAMRRAEEMTSHLDRGMSKVSVAPSRKPDTTATAFSFHGHVARCGSHSIPGHCRTRHTRREFPDVKNAALPIVCYGNKQKLPRTSGSRGVASNFFPFDSGPIWQWCGRRRHVPARVVPRIT